jgi:hypothetical protein
MKEAYLFSGQSKKAKNVHRQIGRRRIDALMDTQIDMQIDSDRQGD